jgi:hypothetical protein
MAAYRVRTDGILKRLKRWPSETGPDRGLDRKGLSVRAPAQHGMPTFGLAVGKSLVTD